LDAKLAPADDPVQSSFVPLRRAVGPENAEALGREREVERPGHGEERHARTVVGRLPRCSEPVLEAPDVLLELLVAGGQLRVATERLLNLRVDRLEPFDGPLRDVDALLWRTGRSRAAAIEERIDALLQLLDPVAVAIVVSAVSRECRRD